MNSKNFFRVLLVVCVLVTIVGIFEGDWLLGLPTLWGIWLYKKDIDEVFDNNTSEPEQDEIEEELSYKQQLIFSLVNSYLTEKPEELLEAYETLDECFEVAGHKEMVCQWCEKHEIQYEYFRDGQDSDLICSRCMCDYIIGYCEHETERINNTHNR